MGNRLGHSKEDLERQKNRAYEEIAKAEVANEATCDIFPKDLREYGGKKLLEMRNNVRESTDVVFIRALGNTAIRIAKDTEDIANEGRRRQAQLRGTKPFKVPGREV